jgi:ATP-dependent NAD(P)H-hydrate dehydratase
MLSLRHRSLPLLSWFLCSSLHSHWFPSYRASVTAAAFGALPATVDSQTRCYYLQNRLHTLGDWRQRKDTQCISSGTNTRTHNPKHTTKFRSVSLHSSTMDSAKSSIPNEKNNSQKDPVVDSKSTTPSTHNKIRTRDWTWQDGKDLALERFILPLDMAARHKGCGGRIGILGGNDRYTGAPYYAAMAALQTGADLATLFTAHEACIPLKSYSPELMVQGVYHARDFQECVAKAKSEHHSNNLDSYLPARQLVDDMVEAVTSSMSSLHCLVIGPGLGRCPLVLIAVKRILRHAREQSLPVILDADALYMLSQEFDGDNRPKESDLQLLQGYRRVVLTPNVFEYKRLLGDSSHSSEGKRNQDYPSSSAHQRHQWLNGVVMVRKGDFDRIERIESETSSSSNASALQWICREPGGRKRSGGLGDILSGTLGTLVAWHFIMQEEKLKKNNKSNTKANDADTEEREGDGNKNEEDDDLLGACWTACCIVKLATRRAYEQKWRSMTAPDVLANIGATFHEMAQADTTPNETH